MGWDAVDGLALYINGHRVDQRTVGVTNHDRYDADAEFYVGRSTSDMSRRHYASAVFDDLQLWEAKRDYLISMNLIRPGSSRGCMLYIMLPRETVLTPQLIHPQNSSKNYSSNYVARRPQANSSPGSNKFI